MKRAMVARVMATATKPTPEPISELTLLVLKEDIVDFPTPLSKMCTQEQTIVKIFASIEVQERNDEGVVLNFSRFLVQKFARQICSVVKDQALLVVYCRNLYVLKFYLAGTS
jgi:hypothetical protein